MMRVFVTGTGRCGSVSFREACKFITNYTAGHESNCGLLEYPNKHIEVNPHIRGLVKTIRAKYPESKWVHLIRDPKTCIPSLAAMDRGIIMEHYGRLYPSVQITPAVSDIAYRFYWQENDLIEVQLKHLIPDFQRMTINLERIKEQWRTFWNWIEAEGDFGKSYESWDTPHNTRQQRGE